MQNVLVEIAKRKNRDYITPEDVTEALQMYNKQRVRYNLLAIIARQVDYGCEDVSLCAFIAYRGKAD
jgi:predicted ATP-dependent protease